MIKSIEMGCNYYAIKKIDDELKSKIIDAVNAENFSEAKDLIPEEVHIGKSSGGWQFIFNHNNWQYFEGSLESLKSFLLSANIFDEYGRRVSNDEFWELVESKKDSDPDLTYGTIRFGLNFSNYANFS